MAVSETAPLVLAIGEPLLEFNQVPGDAARYLRGFGGDTSNFCISASRQGARTGYITRVGDDDFGRSLRALWHEEGVDTAGVETDRDATTGIYFVTHHEGGHEFTYFRKGSAASRLSPDNLPYALLEDAAYMHVSGITQAISVEACDAVFAALAHLRGHGKVITYDPNLRLRLWPAARARAVVEATLRDVDYFLPSLEDATTLTGLEAADDIVSYYLDRGARHVILKMGGDGVMVADAERRQHLAGHVVQVSDTTGAGDCFDGSFVARLAAGDDVMQAVAYANAAAALSTQGFGAVAPIPRPEQVRHLLGAAP
jgi:2-dehydro-3-deoxygluconokinase